MGSNLGFGGVDGHGNEWKTGYVIYDFTLPTNGRR